MKGRTSPLWSKVQLGLVLLTRSSHNGGPRLVLARSDTGSCPPATILHPPCKTSVNHLLAPGHVRLLVYKWRDRLSARTVSARVRQSRLVGAATRSLQEVPLSCGGSAASQLVSWWPRSLRTCERGRSAENTSRWRKLRRWVISTSLFLLSAGFCDYVSCCP